MKVDMTMYQRGEFMAVRRTAHTFDDDGNIIQEGEILQQSAWGKNLITEGGFAAQLAGSINITMVAGSGNTAPLEANTTLQTYKGKYSGSTQIIYSRTLNIVPDVDGYCVLETVYRATFSPGALGSGAVNISEAGMAMGTQGATTGATPLFSRGLLVDSFGAPLVIAMNASTEYLDLYWKHTRYIPAEVTGSSAITILGSNIVHDYIIRPLYLDLSVTNSGISLWSVWWSLGNNWVVGGYTTTLPGLTPVVTDTSYISAQFGPRVFSGAISSNQTTLPAGTQATYAVSGYTFDAYVPGSKSRTFHLNMVPADGNLAAIRSITLKWGFQGWQMEINPTIAKQSTPQRALRLDFTVTLANKP